MERYKSPQKRLDPLYQHGNLTILPLGLINILRSVPATQAQSYYHLVLDVNFLDVGTFVHQQIRMACYSPI